MSKLYEEYQKLKSKDKDKYYLFHNGVFYIFLADDALQLKDVLNLKILPFSKDIVKCGFPQSAYSKYIDILDENKINYELVDNLHKNSLKNTSTVDCSELEILDEIRRLDICKLSPIMAFNILVELKDKLDKK